MNAVVKIEPQQQETASILAVIERAASNPQVDIDKMERLLQMQERVVKRQAEAEFAAALSDMQDELPSIGERGKAKVNGDVRYTFALWEDINSAIKPILKKHGFALSFRTDLADGGISVTGVLSHRSGHSERTTIRLPSDTSGSKNAVQAVASSVSYGKRYTAAALLNLTSHGEDDDAYRATVEYITEKQEATLREWIEATGSKLDQFLKYMKAESLALIPANQYDKAIAALRAKERAK
jgi:hypothetical protein